jgi:hypothetical protein
LEGISLQKRSAKVIFTIIKKQKDIYFPLLAKAIPLS